MNQKKIVTVFGGSGFLGQSVVLRLARAGFVVRVATRTPEACYNLKVLGAPGQIVPQFYHPGRPETIAAAIGGSFAVVNMVGVLSERGRSTFHSAHVELPRGIATACKRHRVARFVHISALGVERGVSKYARTKFQGEQAVRDIFPSVAVLRPSILFGPGDSFFNKFARLAQLLPFLPLIGDGKTRFQPAYVGDVADAVLAVLTGPDSLTGAVYELGGAEVLTLAQVYKRLFAWTGETRPLIPLPWGLARFCAFFLQRLPGAPLTGDQVQSLKTDSIVSPEAKGFAALGIVPTALDTILPIYLCTYHPGGKFAEMKRA